MSHPNLSQVAELPLIPFDMPLGSLPSFQVNCLLLPTGQYTQTKNHTHSLAAITLYFQDDSP
jgi:hypothetical protein